MVEFAGFQLDLEQERLSKGGRQVSLRRKPMAILRHLVENPRRLVTHAELLEHVWRGVSVSDSAMRSHLHELRQVLGEGVIETVIGRGYRFSAEVSDAASPRATADDRPRMVVGRDRELAALQSLLAAARRAERRLCFVTGDPGIGKTTLVDTFVDDLGDDVLVLRGSSIEQHGTPEAYAPIVEMISSLRGSTKRDRVLATLVRHAPTFMLPLAHLLPSRKHEELTAQRARLDGETKPIGELVEAVEVIANDHPVIIVLEDLQWSDVATLDFVAMLGARRAPTRLLLVATARSSEAQTVAHPLHRVLRSLVARGTAAQLVLGEIGEPEVARYLALRYPGHRFPPAFIHAVTDITGGTPLFLVSLIEDLARREMIANGPGGATLALGVEELAAYRPDSVRQLVDMQVDRLPREEQRALEAAAIVGRDFSTALAAAALELTVEEVDDRCDALARRELFLRREAVEEWPGGELHTRYAFRHALVQEVCAERTAPVRRQGWHRRIAERLERAHATNPDPVAHLLAKHYDHGQVPMRAVEHYLLAAERNALRFASADALQMCQRARALLPRIPAGAERDRLELAVLGHLAQAGFRVITAMAQPLEMYERMVALARPTGDAQALATALANLSYRYSTLAQYRRALAVLDEVDELHRSAPLTPAILGFVGTARAVALAWSGSVVEAKSLLAELIETPLPFDPHSPGILGPTNRAGMLRSFLAFMLWAGGDPETGHAEAETVLAIAAASGDPFFLGAARCHVARYEMLNGGSAAAVREMAGAVMAMPEAGAWHAPAAALAAWADAATGPLDDARVEEILRDNDKRIAAFPQGATNVRLTIVWFLRAARRDDEALAQIDRALAFGREHEELVLEAELLRVRGQLLETRRPEEAEAAYAEAHAVAVARGTHTFGLRAALELARLWSNSAKAAEGRSLVEAAMARMAPGQSSAEVSEARVLLGLSR